MEERARLEHDDINNSDIVISLPDDRGNVRNDPSETFSAIFYTLRVALGRITSDAPTVSRIPWTLEIGRTLRELGPALPFFYNERNVSRTDDILTLHDDPGKHVRPLLGEKYDIALYGQVSFLKSVGSSLPKIPQFPKKARHRSLKLMGAVPLRSNIKKRELSSSTTQNHDSSVAMDTGQISVLGSLLVDSMSDSAYETLVSQRSAENDESDFNVYHGLAVKSRAKKFTGNSENRDSEGNTGNRTKAHNPSRYESTIRGQDVMADSVLESLRRILAMLCASEPSCSYKREILRTRGTQKKRAVRIVLECREVWETRTKSGIFSDIVVEAIETAFEDIIFGRALRRVRSWMCRLSVVLELCSCVKICARVIEFLMSGLETLGNAFLGTGSNNFQRTYNQICVLFHGLYIATRKFRAATRYHSEKLVKSAEGDMLPLERLWWNRQSNHDAPLRKTQNIRVTIDAWTVTLDKFAAASIENTPGLAVKSLALVRALDSAWPFVENVVS